MVHAPRHLLLAALAFLSQEGVAQERPVAALGHGLRPLFLLAPNYTNLNHGSFGSPPKMVLEAEHGWQRQMELHPDYWFRYSAPDALYGALDLVRARLAKYINAADAKDVAFVDNASGGVNAVLRSIRLARTAKILYLNTAYQMVKNTIQYVHDHDREAASVEVNISIPSTSADIVGRVREALRRNPSVKLASFSHITSVPAIILPVKELVKVCHRHGVLVLIDGAHALGHIPIDVQDIGADFYVANGHKWLYSPKGSALLWVAPGRQGLIHPTTINYEGQGATAFQVQFSYTGTKDYSPYLAMGSALTFREAVLGGDARIMSYIHRLAVEGGDVLAKAWGTEKLVGDDVIGAMVNVRVPDGAASCCPNLQLPGILFKEYGTWVPAYRWDGRCYVRVSAQVYNELSDFEMLAAAVLSIAKAGCQPPAAGAQALPLPLMLSV